MHVHVSLGEVFCRCMANLSVSLLVGVLARLLSTTHVRTQAPLARLLWHLVAAAHLPSAALALDSPPSVDSFQLWLLWHSTAQAVGR
jgi:hypothetical protein